MNFLFALTNSPQHTYIAVESGVEAPGGQVECAAGAHGCLVKTQPLAPQEELGTGHSHSLARLPAPSPHHTWSAEQILRNREQQGDRL